MGGVWLLILVVFCVACLCVTRNDGHSISDMSDEELIRTDRKLTQLDDYDNAPQWMVYHNNVRAEMKKRGLC